MSWNQNFLSWKKTFFPAATVLFTESHSDAVTRIGRKYKGIGIYRAGPIQRSHGLHPRFPYDFQIHCPLGAGFFEPAARPWHMSVRMRICAQSPCPLSASLFSSWKVELSSIAYPPFLFTCYIFSPCGLALLSPITSCTDKTDQSAVASSFKVCYTVC